MDILKYKMFVQMAEKDTFKSAKAARKQEYLLRLFPKNRNMDSQLELLETIMLE